MNAAVIIEKIAKTGYVFSSHTLYIHQRLFDIDFFHIKPPRIPTQIK
jgi:hypothetical protein